VWSADEVVFAKPTVASKHTPAKKRDKAKRVIVPPP